MHELSLLQALVRELEAVARRYGARRVVAFRLEVGELANAVPELLERAYEALQARHPLLRGGRMTLSWVPVVLNCRECGWEGRWENRRVRCVRCGSDRVGVVAGEDLRLRDVELEIPEEGFP